MDTGRTYAGASGEERRTRRRSRLLDAACELMGAEEEPTVRAVCSRAGVGPRSFYESFASPEELRAAVVEAVVDGAGDAVSAALAQAPVEDRARSRAAVEAFIDYALDDPRRARILFGKAATAESLHEQRTSALRLFANLAAAQGRELYGEAAGSKALAETTSYLIAGGMAELLLAWSRGELHSSRAELVEDTVELLAALGGAAAALAARRAGP